MLTGLETEETELAGPLGSFPSSWAPTWIMSARVSLTKTAGDRLRSILWESSWGFADAPSVKTSTRAREQKRVRTSFLDLTLNILVKVGIFWRGSVRECKIMVVAVREGNKRLNWWAEG